jgi:hypothetical protein
VLGVAGIPLGWAYIRRGVSIGVDIDEAGVVVRGPFSSQRVSKDDIIGVGTHRWFVNMVVHFNLRDGRRLGTNLIQGALVTWPGGNTKDILSVLQRELDTRGKEQEPQPLESAHLPGEGSMDQGVSEEP